ncbi:reverse transcriptase-like protein [Salisediminibacterium halotolerans]|uniref:Ribonuclease HI n=1 Tax=Salisediminibacterium halotolerans TaxID=517425 RepID=A0A1H9RCR7_9BACI|nr:reverse transcriptase-like protein [Salisediminibacterium haloalkalitolerans]SER70546.1 ribonuclease HI [Salisediminibacterium haloalkalitolerans]
MKIWLEFTYKTKQNTETAFVSEEMTVEEALEVAEDLLMTGRVKHLVYVDEQGTSVKKKELETYVKGVQTEPHAITVYFDGGYEKYTRRAGLGCAIYYRQHGRYYRIRKNALVTAIDSNNEAEYAALHLAAKELEALGAHHLPIDVKGDSHVVIKQLAGEWPSYEPELNRWADRIDEKFADLGLLPTYELIDRKDNQEADKLATQALEGIEIESEREVKPREQDV